jgi:hypothetical protein
MKAKSPKSLPWLAKKAGIPLARAEALWIEAVRYATQQAEIVESPEYWKAAVDHLLESIADEAQQRRAAPFGLGPLVRLPARLWLHGLDAQQALMTATAARFWRQRVC